MKQILTILLLIACTMVVFADNLSEAEYYQKKAAMYLRRASQ